MIWVALAGPSGAGKDSLLDQVRADLAEDAQVPFRAANNYPSGAGRGRSA
jgi:ribose 1,5-bisphosphokinase PhnN